MIAVNIINVQVIASLPCVKSNDTYPKYAMIPIVTSMNIEPIWALLPVNTADRPIMNMNTIGIPNYSHIHSIPT